MMSVLFVKLVLMLALSAVVDGLCSYPCNLQKKSFYNEAEPAEFVLPNPYTLTISGPSINPFDITCFQRSGSFILNRRGENNNIYRCIKIIDVCDDAFVVIQTDLFTLNTPPELCDICSPEKLTSLPELWVAKSKTDIGCNVPKSCPAPQGTENQCTGCEENRPDDGMCCGHKNKAEYMQKDPNKNEYYYIDI